MTGEERGLCLSKASLNTRIVNASFHLAPGDCVVVCGPNGSGKSSLLKLLSGLSVPTSGTARLSGTPLARLSPRELAENISWLPQQPRLSEELTCGGVVTAARFRFDESRKEAYRAALRLLEDDGLSHLIDRPITQVSGGELQRVLIAAMIAQEAPYLLVDEPANHLDPAHQVGAYRRLGALWREQGHGTVIVSHDVRLATLLGEPERVRVIGVKGGRLHRETTLRDPHLSVLLEELYEVPFLPGSAPGALALDLRRDSGPT